MLAAGDWVIYAIPIIAFLVWLLATALRPAQPPPSRPQRPRGEEPVVYPESGRSRPPQDIPVVQPVEAPVEPPAGRRDRLQDYLEQRRRERASGTAKAPRRVPRPPVVLPVPPPVLPSGPGQPPVEPVVVPPPPPIVVQEPPPQRPATATRPLPESALRTAAAFPHAPTAPLPRRELPPPLVVLSRFLTDRENLQAAFLLRELLAPPKALRWLAPVRGR